MVLKIAAYGLPVETGLDADLRQMAGRAYARDHQELGRVEGAAGEDHFARGARGPDAAVLEVFDATRRIALEQDAGHVPAGFQGHPTLGDRRMQIGDRRAAPPAVPDAELKSGEALLPGPVIVGRQRVAGLLGRLQENVDQRIVDPADLDRQRPVAAVDAARRSR